MSDVEVDGDVMYNPKPTLCIGSYSSSQYPHTAIGGISRDSLAFSGDASRHAFPVQPKDSLMVTGRTHFPGTNGSGLSSYNQWIHSNNLRTTGQNNVDTGYNFSYSTNFNQRGSGNQYAQFSSLLNGRSPKLTDVSSRNRTTSNQLSTSESDNYQNYSNNVSDNLSVASSLRGSEIPNIDHLSLNETDSQSAFVFHRPQSDVRTPNNKGSQLKELKNSKYPNYKDMTKRMESYAYSLATVRNPRAMSDAGFFAISNQDFVRCFHCGIGLRNWEEDDDPYVEHGRWSPNCQYIKNRKGQEFIDAVQEAVRKVQLEEALEQSETRDGVEEDGPVIYPDLTKDGENHEHYPISVLKKNPLLCNAAQAVMEMGYLPRAIKKAVDILLEDGDLESLTAGRIANLVIDMESRGEKVTIPVQQATETRTDKVMSEEDKMKLEEQNREIKEKTNCIICCEATRAITFLPCGHLVCCAQCAPACSNCAVCRKDIKGTIKVTLA